MVFVYVSPHWHLAQIFPHLSHFSNVSEANRRRQSAHSEFFTSIREVQSRQYGGKTTSSIFSKIFIFITIQKIRQPFSTAASLYLFAIAAVLVSLCVKNKRFAVNTLLNRGVAFVCSDHYLVKRAESARMSVICTLCYRASARMIGLLVHFHDHTPS